MTTRWFWPGILLIPAVGLVVQETLTFSNLSFGASRLEEVQTAFGWGVWVAAPYVAVALPMGVAVRRSRVAWWLSLAAAVGVAILGAVFAVLAQVDTSTDPLAGLTWVLTPLVQLSVAVPTGMVVAVVTVGEVRARVQAGYRFGSSR